MGKAKLNFWNGERLLNGVSANPVCDLGSGEPKFLVLVGNPKVYEEYSIEKHGQEHGATISELWKSLESITLADGSKPIKAKMSDDGKTQEGLEIVDLYPGNTELFQRMSDVLVNVPTYATGSWRTPANIAAEQGMKTRSFKVLTPEREAYMTALSGQLTEQKADITICGGIGYLTDESKGLKALQGKSDLSVKEMPGLVSGLGEKDCGRNTINVGRLLATLEYAEGLQGRVSVNSGNSTVGIVSENRQFANKFKGDSPDPAELYQKGPIVEHTMKVLGKAVGGALGDMEKGKDRAELETKLAAVLMKDYLADPDSFPKNEKDFKKHMQQEAQKYKDGGVDGYDLDGKFTEMTQKLEASNKSLFLGREVEVMEVGKDQSLKQAVAAQVKPAVAPRKRGTKVSKLVATFNDEKAKASGARGEEDMTWKLAQEAAKIGKELTGKPRPTPRKRGPEGGVVPLGR